MDYSREERVNQSEEYLVNENARFRETSLPSILICIIVFVLISSFIVNKSFVYVKAGNWIVLESLHGTVNIHQGPKQVFRFFGRMTIYPNTDTILAEGENGINVTFKDGGTATLSSMFTYELPTKESERFEFVKLFNNNYQDFKNYVRAHTIIKSKQAAADYTTTEATTFRRAEFAMQISNDIMKIPSAPLGKFEQIEFTPIQYSLSGIEFSKAARAFLEKKKFESLIKMGNEIRIAKLYADIAREDTQASIFLSESEADKIRILVSAARRKEIENIKIPSIFRPSSK